MPQDGVHTLGQGPWWHCGRCGRKAKLNTELRWQRSVLCCRDCYDVRVIGNYEAEIALVLSTLIDNPDMRPNENLTNPTIEASQDDIFI